MFEDLRFISVIPVESVLRTKPDEPNFVLHQPGDPSLRQACAGGKPLKTNVVSIDKIDLLWKGIKNLAVAGNLRRL